MLKTMAKINFLKENTFLAMEKRKARTSWQGEKKRSKQALARAKKKARDRKTLGNGKASNHHHVCVCVIMCVVVLFAHLCISNIKTRVSSKALDKPRNKGSHFKT